MSAQQPFRLVAPVAGTLAMAVVVLGFWKAIFWAIVLAVLFRPLQVRLAVLLGGRASLAAGLAVLTALLLVILPALLLGAALLEEAAVVHGRVTRGEIDPGAVVERLRELLPALEAWVARIGVDLRQVADSLRAFALNAGQFGLGLLVSTAQGSLGFMVRFFLCLYLLFFLVRDGDAVHAAVVGAMPAPDDARRFLDQFADVARATVQGSLAVAVVQGSLGALIFWLLGIPGAAFWGGLMALLSLVPVVGPPVVWAPAALLRLVDGDIAGAAVLTAFGLLVIGMVDNLLRPLLVGRATRLSDPVVLVSTLGGIATFGITGIVLGPLVATFFIVSWQVYGGRGAPGAA